MRWLVLCIVGGICEPNSIVQNVRVDDWTAELVVIASNAGKRHDLFCTVIKSCTCYAVRQYEYEPWKT